MHASEYCSVSCQDWHVGQKPAMAARREKAMGCMLGCCAESGTPSVAMAEWRRHEKARGNKSISTIETPDLHRASHSGVLSVLQISFRFQSVAVRVKGV